ncbi:MAG: divalent-cation tolerance protein CutA [Oceanococcus sp.]
MTDKLSILFTTCPPAQAQALAQQLVSSGRAACVNIIPQLQSVYQWQGELQHDEEALLMIKTAWPDQEELFTWLAAQHPYQVPEIVSLSGEKTLPSYLQWVIDQSGTAP